MRHKVRGGREGLPKGLGGTAGTSPATKRPLHWSMCLRGGSSLKYELKVERGRRAVEAEYRGYGCNGHLWDTFRSCLRQLQPSKSLRSGQQQNQIRVVKGMQEHPEHSIIQLCTHEKKKLWMECNAGVTMANAC